MLLSSVIAGVVNLRANPLRTLLSTLGVIIGVASLVAILALADGLEQFSRNQIETTTDLQMIVVDSRMVSNEGGMQVRRTDAVIISPLRADSLAAALGDRARVAITLTGSAWLTSSADTTRRATLVMATSPNSDSLFGRTLGVGRFLSAGDSALRPRPAVASAGLVRVSGGNASALLNRDVSLDGHAYRIVGVLAGNETQSPRLVVPLDSATLDWLGDHGRSAPTVAIKVKRAEQVESVRSEVGRWLERYGPVTRNFTVQSQVTRAAQMRQGVLVFKLIMGSITGISILVGGIGIMNILLASVAERTREIGIRRAVGARARDILLQFLAESVAISAAGALIGVIIGLVGAFGITALIRALTEARITAAFSWASVLVSMICALLVGIVFGTYPARRASRLSPVEAIRHE